MKDYKGCYNCSYSKCEQVLTQDRLDVDLEWFCLHKDDYIYEDTGKHCKYWDEKKES